MLAPSSLHGASVFRNFGYPQPHGGTSAPCVAQVWQTGVSAAGACTSVSFLKHLLRSLSLGAHQNILVAPFVSGIALLLRKFALKTLGAQPGL